MTRPPEFTTEQIIEAGKALQAANRTITGFALRQQVGGGNPSRLKQVWDEFLKGKASTVAAAERVADLPVEVAEEMAAVAKALTERLATFAVDLNDKANKAADGRVAEANAAAAAQRESDLREQTDAIRTIQDLEAKLGVATAEAAALTARLAERDTALQAQAVELAQVCERLTLTEQAARSANEEHVVTVAEVVSLRDAVAHAASTEAGLKATVDQMSHQIQLLTSQLERGHADQEVARQEHAAELARIVETVRLAQSEALDLRSKLDKANDVEVTLRGELGQLRDHLGTVTADRDKAWLDVNTAREQVAAITAQREEAQAAALQAREQSAALRGQVDALKEQNAQLLQAFKPAVDKEE